MKVKRFKDKNARTRKNMEEFGIQPRNVILVEPLVGSTSISKSYSLFKYGISDNFSLGITTTPIFMPSFINAKYAQKLKDKWYAKRKWYRYHFRHPI